MRRESVAPKSEISDQCSDTNLARVNSKLQLYRKLAAPVAADLLDGQREDGARLAGRRL